MKEITSAQHPLIKYWMRLRDESSFRKTESRVLLEGKNCIQDVCASIKPKRIILTNPDLNQDLAIDADEVVLITDTLMKKISAVQTPEGIIAELELPNKPLTSVRKLLVADRIQDPGNLGTLIRSCYAFGWDGFFLLPGTVDPYNDKALRAAKGATFHLPIISGSWDELNALVQQNNLNLIVADVSGNSPSECTTPLALVLGNEAQGAKVPIPHTKVSLPMRGSMESLNVAVAGSILLYLFQDTL